MTDEKRCLVTFDWKRGKAEPTSDSLQVAEISEGMAAVVKPQHDPLQL